MIALGGGAVETPSDPGARCASARSRSARRRSPTTAWARVARQRRGRSRATRSSFRALYDERRAALPRSARDAVARDADGVVLAAGGSPSSRPGSLARLAELVAEPASASSSRTRRCSGSTAPPLEAAACTQLPAGEEAKSARARRAALARATARPRAARSSRFGGGCTTDAAGFAPRPTCAASPGSRCRRRSSARSTRRSAARPRSTSRKARTSSAPSTGPTRRVIDPALLETLPGGRAPGGHGRGREDGPARRRAALGAAGCGARAPLRRLQGGRLPARPARAGRAGDPQPRPHVRARARGGGRLRRPRPRRGGRARAARRAAALRAATPTASRKSLAPQPARVDREAAWAALARDKKARERQAAARAARSARAAGDRRRASRCRGPRARSTR